MPLFNLSMHQMGWNWPQAVCILRSLFTAITVHRPCGVKGTQVLSFQPTQGAVWVKLTPQMLLHKSHCSSKQQAVLLGSKLPRSTCLWTPSQDCGRDKQIIICKSIVCTKHVIEFHCTISLSNKAISLAVRGLCHSDANLQLQAVPTHLVTRQWFCHTCEWDEIKIGGQGLTGEERLNADYANSDVTVKLFFKQFRIKRFLTATIIKKNGFS